MGKIILCIFLLFSKFLKCAFTYDIYVSNTTSNEKGTINEPYHNMTTAINNINCSESVVIILMDQTNILSGSFLQRSCNIFFK